jgi:hypothetical protein
MLGSMLASIFLEISRRRSNEISSWHAPVLGPHIFAKPVPIKASSSTDRDAQQANPNLNLCFTPNPAEPPISILSARFPAQNGPNRSQDASGFAPSWAHHAPHPGSQSPSSRSRTSTLLQRLGIREYRNSRFSLARNIQGVLLDGTYVTSATTARSMSVKSKQFIMIATKRSTFPDFLGILSRFWGILTGREGRRFVNMRFYLLEIAGCLT